MSALRFFMTRTVVEEKKFLDKNGRVIDTELIFGPLLMVEINVIAPFGHGVVTKALSVENFDSMIETLQDLRSQIRTPK